MKQKKSLGERISWLIHFLLHDIFRITEAELSRSTRFLLRLLKKLILSVRGFVDDNLIVKASALTYYTVLAIVPIFALFVAVGKGLGFSEIIEGFVIEILGDNPEITSIVMGFVNNSLEYAQGGLFVGIGVTVLLWAIISMFRQIEANFNDIWNVKKNAHKIMKGKLGEPEFKILPEYAIPTGAVGHNDIQVTDHAIYVIYRGVSMKDEMLAYQKGKPLPTGGKTVRVFSLEGEPLKEYKLDHSVSGIWVMEEEGRMWALDVNSDEPLVEYTLK